MRRTLLVGIGLLAMVGIADAQLKGFNQGDDNVRTLKTREGQVLHPTIPYTDIRDYSKGRSYVVEDGVAYPTIPYTDIRDYSRGDGFVVEDD